ncbi:MAG: FG-GAP-like repeat-containing protein [Kiritimatiellae bacterium]|nr:FG-GAP-like repeat-containing protein [Kiritimatiellia bacterium]
MGKIDPNLGGTDIPVVDISPAGGFYVPAYTPPAGGEPFPAVVWTNYPTLTPGATFTGSFGVRLLDTPPLPGIGSYINTVWLDSIYTDPISSSLKVSWPVDETPYGIFAKGDNLDSYFGITAGEDDRELFVKPGASFPYGLAVHNSGMVALNDLIFVDMVPAGTTFKSAWFTDPWLQTNAVIFYSTVDTGDVSAPPAYGPANAPADIDVDGGDFWSTELPANPADVKWVAFYIPAVNSRFSEPGAAGWIDGAPRSAVGYFDVTVSPTLLEPTPCIDKLITNRGIFNAFGYTPLAGGTKMAATLRATNDETTRVSVDKPKLAFSAPGKVAPSVLEKPGQLAYTVTVMNRGTAMAEDVLLEIRWPSANVNGVRQHISFDSVSPASIVEFDPENGRLVLEMGNLAPGATAPATLKASVSGGLVFGQQLTFSSTATATARCSPGPASDVASAVVRFAPSLKVHKNDVLDLIPSGGTLDYELALYNTGDAPSRGTFVVDRIPDEMVLVHATGPNGERVWFSATDNIPPSFLTPMTPINGATIAANFAPGTKNGDVWTSPFGEQTRWVAWEMDREIGDLKLYPVGGTSVVGMRVKNDLDGPGLGTEGSPEGVQIFNTTGVFSSELLQAIGNEVVTTIKNAPGILVEKTGPDVVSRGDTFSWIVTYYNNSGMDDDVVTIVDTLPQGAEFLSATHAWNAAALANGAPANNSGQVVPSVVETTSEGNTRIVFNISGNNGYRGEGAKLRSREGGTLKITVRAKNDLKTNAELLNRVTGTATAGSDTTTSSDEDLVLVRNAELRVRKVASPEFPVAGDTVTYNLIVANSGQMAARDLVITDQFPTGISYVEGSTVMLTSGYTIGQPVVSDGALTWSVANSNALTKAGLLPGVLPGLSGDVVIQYKGVVASTVAPGTHLPNSVTVSTVTPEDGTEPNDDEASVDTPYPDPAIVKDGPAIVQSGDRFDWNLTYYNATRQAGENVYIIDSLPDADGDGLVDVTFVEQRADGPAAVTAYYHSGSSATVPPFDPADPLSGGWTEEPVVPVQHIAWLVGTLPGSAGPYSIAVTVIATPPTGAAALPPGTALNNFVEIFVSGKDQNPDNNADEHTVRTPASDVALTKTGSTEGDTPGLVPGEEIVYEIVVENVGTEIAYGIEVKDVLPASLELTDDGAAGILALVNAEGEPVLPIDADGHEITTSVPLTRVVTTNGVAWFFGSADVTSANYYRNVGILPGQKQTITFAATVALDVPCGTPIVNTATVTIRNRNDSEPAEEYLDNNTDSTETVVYRADVAVRKSVVDARTGDSDWTESGNFLKYTIEYNNLGNAVARDTVISEIVPEGTTLVSINNPDGSTVVYYPEAGAGARSFDVLLGDLGPSINKAVIGDYGAMGAVKIANDKGGLPAGSLMSGDYFGSSVVAIGDVNGDGVPDLLIGAVYNDDGAFNSGGAWVLMMNSDGTVQSAVELANGRNGIPSGTFAANEQVGIYASGLGDVDGDGVPDVILARQTAPGGAYVILLNSDGTAKSTVKIQNGMNGVPAGFFTSSDQAGYKICGGTDMDGDGVPEVCIGNQSRLNVFLLLLNADGTVKRAINYRPGVNGIPGTPEFTALGKNWTGATPIGDVDGNGVQDIFIEVHWRITIWARASLRCSIRTSPSNARFA